MTIVTTLDGRGVHHGLTINSFSSLSLDPPLLLWNLGHRSSARAVFEANEHWAVHVLSVDQAIGQHDQNGRTDHNVG